MLVELDPQGRQDLTLIRETRELAPLLLPDAAALTLLAWARAAAQLGVAFAEAGVFKGGSARLLCEVKGAAPLHLFDAFETLQRGSLDGGERAVRDHFGAIHSSLEAVRALLAPYEGVGFHPGWFPASADAARDERFAFVHLDLDLAQGTRDALEFFYPRMVPGGIIVGDDHNLPEVREAFGAFFSGRPDTMTALPWGQVVVVKANSQPL